MNLKTNSQPMQQHQYNLLMALVKNVAAVLELRFGAFSFIPVERPPPKATKGMYDDAKFKTNLEIFWIFENQV